MNVQEKALGWLKERISAIDRSISNFLDLSGGEIRRLKEERETLEVAEHSIQRQVQSHAISPKRFPGGYACPRCGHHFEGKPFFCHYCGQHVTYNETEKTTKVNQVEKIAAELNIVPDGCSGDNIFAIKVGTTVIKIDIGDITNTIENNGDSSTKTIITVDYAEYK